MTVNELEKRKFITAKEDKKEARKNLAQSLRLVNI